MKLLERILQAIDSAVYCILDQTLSTATDIWWRITRRKEK